MTRSAEDVAKLWVEAMRDGKPEVMDSLIAPNATVWHSWDNHLLDFHKARQAERDAAPPGSVPPRNPFSDFSYQTTKKGALIEMTLRGWSAQPAPVHVVHVLTIKDGLVTHSNVYGAIQRPLGSSQSSNEADNASSSAPPWQVGEGRPM